VGLKRSVTRLAAVRRCSSSKPAERLPRDHPALCCARSDLAEAEAGIQAGRPTPPAAHPQRHLAASADRLGVVAAAMSKAQHIDARRTLALVREAQDHLRYAERVLPGFEIVALVESCARCAAPRS